MNPIVRKSKTIVSDGFVTGQTFIKFTPPAELDQTGGQRVITKALQVFTTTTLAAIGGATPFTAANLLNLTLNLKLVNKTKVIIDLPLATLIRGSNGGFYYVLDNLEIDWRESYAEVQLATGLTAAAVLPIEVVYDSNKD